MDLLNRITIKSRMVLSFVLVLVFFIVFAMLSIIEMNELAELTSTLYDHPLKVSNAALEAKADVIRMHRSMKDVSMSKTEVEIHQAIQKIQSEEKLVYQNLDIIKSLILGQEGKKLVNEVIELFAGWKPIQVQVEQFIIKGDREAAGHITRTRGADYELRLERKMVELTSYAIGKADGFMAEAWAMQKRVLRNTIIFIIATIFLSLLIAYLIAKSILSSVSALKDTMSEVTQTGTLIKSELAGKNEISDMARHFNRLVDRLQGQFWLKDGQNSLSEEMAGDLTYEDLVIKSTHFISRYVGACAGALYAYDKKRSLCELKASYAFVEGKQFSSEFGLGEGIVGQVAVEKKPILLEGITRVEALGKTGTVNEPPKNIYAVPLLYEEGLYGVLEVATFEEINPLKIEFLNMAAPMISTSLYSALQGVQIKSLLESTQKANEELAAQAEELQSQAEELQQTSDELQEQNTELEAQRRQVEEANRLKSEFLSNMSHELRTPLNSVMALSRVLIMQTKEKLSEEETNYLEIIERNGKNLLSLINDILDLSKIEAGRMDVSPKQFSIRSTIDVIAENLEPLAKEKGIEIIQQIPEDLPRIESDESRVHQILQNIIGNGVKFTNKGSVTVSASSDTEKVYIKVKDTGIGISNKDLPHIFDEFRQVDGSSSRMYEGTGLGLAIAYKAAKILGGDMSVESVSGKGTTFTVTLPIKWEGEASIYEPIIAGPPSETIGAGQKTVLVVDDEPNVVLMISEYLTGEGYNTITATSGKKALELAETHRPFAITLDVIMPEMDGWEVLQNLKKNPETADIPVIIVSVSGDRATGFALGAVGSITKPFTRDALIAEINKIGRPRPHSIMVVDDNEIDLREMARVIEEEGIKTVLAGSGSNCMEMLKEDSPDILVLDLMMPEMDGFEVLDRIRMDPKTGNLPVIIVTAKDLSIEDRKRLKGSVSSILAKSDTTSRALLEEIKKILIKIERHAESPEDNRARRDTRILLVEDNESSVIQVKRILENEGFIVHVARDGGEALDYMKGSIPDGIILDLMMPGVDGFEVLEKIRSTKATTGIPVLILTAKDLTPDDLKRLRSNNVQQLIQKGDVDRERLLFKTGQMLGVGLETGDLKLETGNLKLETGKPQPGIPLSEGQPATILVVEDNPDNMMTIKAILKGNYNILEATDGEGGLRTVLEEKPDLVLLDMSLPKMDGFEVVRNIKEDENARHIPVIALTARAMKGDREQIIEAGCDDYISKPVDPEEVLKKIMDRMEG